MRRRAARVHAPGGRRAPRAAGVLAALLLVAAPLPSAGQFEGARAAMVDEVERTAAEAAAWTGRERLAPAVIAALARVPRHAFVPPPLERFAYLDRPLPIGEGQTISQPYIVALMSDLLDVGPGDRVLEVGTGSGYQAAVLAEMGVAVWSIEIIDALARDAAERLRRLGYAGVTVRAGDGYHGWPEHAPFDGIVVTAAAPHVPQPLVEQLAEGGTLVIPVGPQHGDQRLLAIEKGAGGELTTREVLPVRFVPLTRAR